jgi:hypothetical protein
LAAVDESLLLFFMFTHKFEGSQCGLIQREYRFPS